ncbi:hypothetical protein VM1G_03641 [Cytospora mali]|uniref:Uncharacterized protein n=1 Tax=Cytospora mali TaxID=578113 RepID=A0A194VW82_CYTMA|nr:hypothetical protein VM1G_03641 [Valsa mali]
MAWGSWSYKPVGDDAADAENQAGCSPDTTHHSGRGTALPGFLTPATAIPPHTLWATLSSVVAAVLLALFIFMPRPWLPADHPGQTRHVGCGNSTAEAQAAGCKFDILSYTWVQPACFDQELMYEFLGRANWRWYPDEETVQELTVNEVANGQREYVYVTWEYYMTHCTYMWKKMHRSLMTSRSLDSYIFDYRHTEQCEMVLLDREHQLDSRSVMLVSKYPSCPIAAD